ncbi:MAG: hypothetical protein KAT32_02480 [Candidatus Moranbacteria bacterium]|nr:hypothetical protein [Candidatus Moranbacteria bacterium]
MKIKITIQEKNVTLSLEKEENILSEKKWVDENNLLEKFFPALDEILDENNLKVIDLKDFTLETDVPKGYTTERIARTIVQTFNFALE